MEKVNRSPIKKKEQKTVETAKPEMEKEKDIDVTNLNNSGKEEIKTDVKKIEEKKKIKKTEAVIRGLNIPISSKQAFAISKFIKHKEIANAIKELEEILLHKRALPMKGEIPHRKGKRMMSGRYPKNAIEAYIKLLKSLNANANVNEISNPTISEAYANFASRPYGKFGRVRKKRTNLIIVAKENKLLTNKKGKKEMKQ